MSNKDHIKKKVDKTLQALDGLERAEADPFFYSRLSSKIEHRSEEETQLQTEKEFGFAFSVAVLLIIISLNLMFISSYRQSKTNLETSYAEEQLMEELANDFQAFNLGYYEDFETVEE